MSFRLRPTKPPSEEGASKPKFRLVPRPDRPSYAEDLANRPADFRWPDEPIINRQRIHYEDVHGEPHWLDKPQPAIGSALTRYGTAVGIGYGLGGPVGGGLALIGTAAGDLVKYAGGGEDLQIAADMATSGGVGGLMRRLPRELGRELWTTPVREQMEAAASRHVQADLLPEARMPGVTRRADEALRRVPDDGPGSPTSLDILGNRASPTEVPVTPHTREVRESIVRGPDLRWQDRMHALPAPGEYRGRLRERAHANQEELLEAENRLGAGGYPDDFVGRTLDDYSAMDERVRAAYADVPEDIGTFSSSPLSDHIAGLGPAERRRLPGEVRSLVAEYEKAGGRITLAESEEFRKTVGGYASEAWQRGNREEWRTLKNLRKAVDDVQASRAAEGDAPRASVAALDQARSLRARQGRHFDDFGFHDMSKETFEGVVGPIVRDHRQLRRLMDSLAERGAHDSLEDLRTGILQMVLGDEMVRDTARGASKKINRYRKALEIAFGDKHKADELLRLQRRRMLMGDTTRSSTSGGPTVKPAASAEVDALSLMSGNMQEAGRGAVQFVRRVVQTDGVARVLAQADLDPELMRLLIQPVRTRSAEAVARWARRVAPYLERAGYRRMENAQ